MALYIETSAVLSWLFGEPNSSHAIEVINAASAPLSSTLTILETHRAILRARHAGMINETQAVRLRTIFHDALRSWELMQPTEQIQRRAAEAFPVEPVRSLDALHLATALQFVELYDSVSVLSFDARIVTNVAALGLAAV